MPERIPQSVAKLVVLRAYLASDHVTPATGKTIAITISKNGGAFGNPNAGATNATEISSGFYKFTLDTADTGTKGPVAWRGAVATIDDTGDAYEVVNATNAGFTALPDVASGSPGAALVDGTGTAAISNSSGKVLLQATQSGVTIPTVTTLTNLPAITTDWLTATGLAASAVTEIRDAITGYSGAFNLDSSGNVKVSDGTGANQIDTSSGAIAHVILSDTITTYTGDTPQTGDAYARIGVAGVSLSAIPDLAGVTTLLSRLSATRAGYLDNLSAGAVATAASIAALNNLSAAQVWAAGTRTLSGLGFTLGASDLASGIITAAKFAADAIDSSALATSAVQEIRNAITGGAYSLDTDSNGAMRIVDGTGAREIDTASGAIARVVLADTATTLTNDPTGVGTLLSRLTATRAGYLDNLSGGAVALASGVTVSDKTGFKLASDGLDSVLVESGITASADLTSDAGSQLTSINARQALCLQIAALAGVISGAATTTAVIKPAGKPGGNTRVSATVDADGNRSSLVLKVAT